MKKDLTDIVVLLDRSGSMSPIAADTIGGLNSFIEQQKALPGEGFFTCIQFDDQYETLVPRTNLRDLGAIPAGSYLPRGTTALLDSLNRLITETGVRLSQTPESERPEYVIFVVITDGAENASQKTTLPQLSKMINHQTDVYKWKFVFLGANIDAFATGASMGMQGFNYRATPSGVVRAMNHGSAVVGASRMTSAVRSSAQGQAVIASLDAARDVEDPAAIQAAEAFFKSQTSGK